jgi:hypothetical protein
MRDLYRALRLPAAARTERRRDRRGIPPDDPGIGAAVDAAIAWLCRAQDHSATRDGGVARHFSLLTGWGASYPETTGYIVPTMLACAKRGNRAELRDRARRMLDWLVSIQLPQGAFQGGLVDSTPVVPVVFNTGQILLGLAAGVAEFGTPYDAPMRRAADWLVAAQEEDGCWRRHASPFAGPGDKAYDTHVAWALLEAARVGADARYAEAALKNVRWALTRQRENGWFDDCCLTDPSRPLTHTLGYALRGVVEAFRFTRDPAFRDAARRTADGLLSATGADGFLSGRLDAGWRAAVPWACLTGTVQVAICWLMLYEDSGDVRYLDAARAADRYVRRTVRTSGAMDTLGAVKGSFPVDGAYGEFQYLNWACKFFIDANLLESAVAGSPASRRGGSDASPTGTASTSAEASVGGEPRIARLECRAEVSQAEWDGEVRRLGGSFHHCHAQATYEAGAGNAEPLFMRALDGEGRCVAVMVASIASPRLPLLARVGKRATVPALPATVDGNPALELAMMAAAEDELARRGVFEIHVASYDSPHSAEVLGALGYRLTERAEFYVDLTPPLESIWKDLKETRRRNVRKAERLGLTTGVDQSPPALRALDRFQAEALGRHGVAHRTMDDRLEAAKLRLLGSDQALVLMSVCDGAPTNGAMFGVFGERAYYLSSGSSVTGNERCGPVHLIWTAIRVLKERGVRSLNLGGAVAPGTDTAAGSELYRFKKDFGSAVVRQPAGVKVVRRLGAFAHGLAARIKRAGGR